MKESLIMDVVAFKKHMVDQGIERTTDLSRKTKVNRNTLGEILNGKRQPSSEVMRKLVVGTNMPSEKAGQIFFGKKLT